MSSNKVIWGVFTQYPISYRDLGGIILTLISCQQGHLRYYFFMFSFLFLFFLVLFFLLFFFFLFLFWPTNNKDTQIPKKNIYIHKQFSSFSFSTSSLFFLLLTFLFISLLWMFFLFSFLFYFSFFPFSSRAPPSPLLFSFFCFISPLFGRNNWKLLCLQLPLVLLMKMASCYLCSMIMKPSRLQMLVGA